MDEGGSRNGAFLSEEAQCGGLLYWGPCSFFFFIIVYMVVCFCLIL